MRPNFEIDHIGAHFGNNLNFISPAKLILIGIPVNDLSVNQGLIQIKYKSYLACLGEWQMNLFRYIFGNGCIFEYFKTRKRVHQVRKV